VTAMIQTGLNPITLQGMKIGLVVHEMVR